MRPLPLFLLLLATTLPACKSTRTVLAGPQNPQLDINDYDPQKESASSVAGQQAAAMGMVGSQFGEGKGMSQRFGSADPFGYNRVDKNGNTVMGLNALGEKVFGGTSKTKDMKSFNQTRDFLAKRYSNTKEIGQKESSVQNSKSWLGGRKASVSQIARETGQDYRDSARLLATKRSREEGRTITERSSREEKRTAHTGDYYPAKKVMDEGRDAPLIVRSPNSDKSIDVGNAKRSRSRSSDVTIDDIREMLGKEQLPR